jgi:hypothetical protein
MVAAILDRGGLAGRRLLAGRGDLSPAARRAMTYAAARASQTPGLADPEALTPVDHAVDEPVDKRRSLGRTTRVLWMNRGWPKNLGIGARKPLVRPAQEA